MSEWYKDLKPYSEKQLREDMRPALLSKTLTDRHYLKAGAKKLVDPGAPAHNPDTQRIFSEVMEVDGNPTRVWQVEDIPQSELEEQAKKELKAFIEAVNRECERRIYAVASDNAQKNLAARSGRNKLTPEQLVVYDAGLDWIDDMQKAARSIVATNNKSYKDDKHWPAPTQEMINLANAY